MFKLNFNTRKNDFKSRCAPWLLAAILTIAVPGSASATGGSWGGSGGFGSGGGSWGGSGGGSGGSGGSWGGSGGSWGGSGGSWGGSGGGLLGGRRPVRNLLGRVASRLGSGSLGSGGSNGGSFGGSTGGGSGGSLGSATGSTGGSSGSAYGSWGSGYSSNLMTDSPSYVSTELSAPAYSTQFATQSLVDTSAFATTAVMGCLSCDSNGLGGISMGNGHVETGYQSDTGFHDGALPNYDGAPVDGGQIIDDESLYDPGTTGPNDYYDGSDSLLDNGPLPPPGPSGDDSTRWRKNRKPTVKPAVLSVALPADAEVYINGRLTKTEGSVRNYVARKLKAGKWSGYHVKAVINRDGKRLVRTQMVRMKLGVTRTVEFDFNRPATTVLALKVPADAQVRLCGTETSATGERRFFETSKLKDGQSWEDYEIEVVVKRDGKEVVARKSLELCAGESQSIVFDFEDSTGKLVAVK